MNCVALTKLERVPDLSPSQIKTGTPSASFSKLLFILYKAPLYNRHLPLAYIVNKCTPALGLSSQSSLEKGVRPGKLRVSFSAASSTPGSEDIIWAHLWACAKHLSAE